MGSPQPACARCRATIVGGGVLGIDMAAHLGALDQAGQTVGVLAKPVEDGIHPYKPRRSFLENGILANGGALVSECRDTVSDTRERLLQRDRIITALSDIFVAVECSETSATVDSTRRAKLQGKMV